MISFTACTNERTHVTAVDVQGHRGCRGLYPENTIPAFMHAIDLGVNTLEMDVVISKDSVVVVSHEAFFNPEITTKPDGTYFESEAEAKKLSLYQLNLREIQNYDVGLKTHPRFGDQKKLAAYKPSLDEVIKQCEARAAVSGKLVHYNIEIKVEENGTGLFQPDNTKFVSLVGNVILQHGIQKKVTLQSFEPEIVNEIHSLYPDFKTVILVENTEDIATNLGRLNHKPYAYSPGYRLVSHEMISVLHQQGIKVIPWTVNEETAITTLLGMGIDGIISDYPDRVLKIVSKKKT